MSTEVRELVTRLVAHLAGDDAAVRSVLGRLVQANRVAAIMHLAWLDVRGQRIRLLFERVCNRDTAELARVVKELRRDPRLKHELWGAHGSLGRRVPVLRYLQSHAVGDESSEEMIDDAAAAEASGESDDEAWFLCDSPDDADSDVGHPGSPQELSTPSPPHHQESSPPPPHESSPQELFW